MIQCQQPVYLKSNVGINFPILGLGHLPSLSSDFQLCILHLDIAVLLGTFLLCAFLVVVLILVVVLVLIVLALVVLIPIVVALSGGAVASATKLGLAA